MLVGLFVVTVFVTAETGVCGNLGQMNNGCVCCGFGSRRACSTDFPVVDIVSEMLRSPSGPAKWLVGFNYLLSTLLAAAVRKLI